MFIYDLFQLNNKANYVFGSDQYYCYELIDPNTNKPFYVGKGSNYRFTHHCFKHCGNNNHKKYKIKQILAQFGAIPVNIISVHLNEDDAYMFEQQQINLHGTKYDNTGYLTNMTKGGPGGSALQTQIDQYNLYGEFIQTHNSYHAAALSVGGNLNTEKQILECCRGATPTCKDFYWTYTGKPIQRKRTKIKPIARLAPDGTIIERFISVAQAVKLLGGDKTNIPNAIIRNGTAYGYKWKYLDV